MCRAPLGWELRRFWEPVVCQGKTEAETPRFFLETTAQKTKILGWEKSLNILRVCQHEAVQAGGMPTRGRCPCEISWVLVGNFEKQTSHIGHQNGAEH